MSRILIIDDERRLVDSLTRALRARGLEADGAYDGERGLELALGGTYALVVLDLRLPKLNGVEVLRATMKSRPEQPVLVLSALEGVAAKVRCLEAGAADYLTKPFSVAELLARVQARLREPFHPRAQGHLRVGELTLDPVRRTADAGSGDVALSTREFLLLRHLMRRPGEVCTRDELLADVWGCAFDPGTNVVNVYVGRLRAKLGGTLIETVRNVGYALDPA